jgi:hypothetical protein
MVYHLLISKSVMKREIKQANTMDVCRDLLRKSHKWGLGGLCHRL